MDARTLNNSRELTMADPVYTLLTECIRGRLRINTFSLARGKSGKRRRDMWANACKQANLAVLLFHGLRRMAARKLRRARNRGRCHLRKSEDGERVRHSSAMLSWIRTTSAAMKKLQASEQEATNSYNSVTVELKSVTVAKAQIVN
jgi:hypothetical protein